MGDMSYDTLKETRKLFFQNYRPGQVVTQPKVLDKLALSRDQWYPVKRLLQSEGWLTEERKNRTTYYTLHKTPLPEDKRQKPLTRNRTSVASNGVFTTEATFKVAGGVYTAQQLRHLAKAVLKALGE